MTVDLAQTVCRAEGEPDVYGWLSSHRAVALAKHGPQERLGSSRELI